MKPSVLREKSFAFAVRVVKLSQFLQEKKEYVLSKQILRSGTAVGALVREAQFGQTKPDFVHKLSIAVKEANETEYWLALLHETNFIDPKLYKSLNSDCEALQKILIASIKTAKDGKQ